MIEASFEQKLCGNVTIFKELDQTNKSISLKCNLVFEKG